VTKAGVDVSQAGVKAVEHVGGQVLE